MSIVTWSYFLMYPSVLEILVRYWFMPRNHKLWEMTPWSSLFFVTVKYALYCPLITNLFLPLNCTWQKKPGSSLESTSFSGRKALAMMTMLIHSDQRFLRLWETVNISSSLQHSVHPTLTPKICRKVGYLFSKLAVLWCLSQSTGKQCLCMYLKETQFYYSHHTKQHNFIDSYMRNAKIDSSIPESIWFDSPIFWTCSTLWLTCLPMSHWIGIDNRMNWVRVEFGSM